MQELKEKYSGPVQKVNFVNHDRCLHSADIKIFSWSNRGNNYVQVQLGDEPECDSHVVEQLHLTTWPDHGVPSILSNLTGLPLSLSLSSPSLPSRGGAAPSHHLA